MKTVPQRLVLGKVGRHYWLANPSQKEFEEFCEGHKHSKLHYLTIAGSTRGYKLVNFTSLTKIPSLTDLYLEDAITQAQLEQVSANQNLTTLAIEHSGKLVSLEPLAALQQLRELTISRPVGWVSKHARLHSVTPLHSLSDLEYLNLAGMAFESGGLAPLASLKKLKTLIVISDYWNEAEELSRQLPSLDYQRPL